MSGIKPVSIRSDCRIIVVAATVAEFLTKSEKTSASEGDTFYDTTLNQLRTHDGSSWSPAGMNSAVAGSWNVVMGIGAIVTTDNAAEIQISGATSPLLTLDANGTTNVNILDVSSAAGSGHLIDLAQSGTGKDVDGSGSTWTVTRLGVGTFAGLGLADSKNLSFGDSGDITVDYVDGGTPGTAGKGLLFTQTVSDDNIQFGDASLSFDVLFIGDTSTNNFMQWDLNGGAGSVGALVFDNTDIDLGDSDLIRFGDAPDFTLGYVDSGDKLNLLGSGKTFEIGVTGEGMDVNWYTENTGDYVYFDETNALVDFVDVDLDLDDDAILRFGSSNDITMQFDGGDFLVDGVAADTTIKIGATNNQNLVIYGATITNLITFTTANATLECIFDNFDLRLKDDDYVLFGNAASAGGDTDGTIRWDNTSSVLEIIGATQFEDNVTMDGNLTLSGTLIMSGALAPGSIALGDTEILSFGDGTDYTISTAGSTAALIIAAQTGDDAVQIGDGSTATDFIIQNTQTTDADIWWDDSAETLYFGKDDDGIDVQFYGGTSGADMLWDFGSDQLVLIGGSSISLNDNVELLLGTGSTNAGDFKIDSDGSTLFIREIVGNGAGVEIGADNKGLDVKFFGETGSSFMEWTQASDALIFDAADINMGDGDIIVLGDGTDLSLSATGTTVTATLAAGSAWNISDTDDVASKVTFGVTGGSNGLDVQFNTISSGEDMIFDAGAKTFTLDNVDIYMGDDDLINFGDGQDITFGFDGTNLELFCTTTDVPFAIGGATNGFDITYYFATAGTIAIDHDGDDITLSDAVSLQFGTGQDVSLQFDGTNLELFCTTTDVPFAIGDTTNGFDLTYYFATAGTIAFDHDGDSVTFSDDMELRFGSGSGGDVTINWNQSVLAIEAPAAANAVVSFGETNNLDIVIYGDNTNQDVEFDTSAETVTFTDFNITMTGTTSAEITCALQNDKGGLIIPQHGTSAPVTTENPALGAIFYEIDASTLWIHDTTNTWAGIVFDQSVA